MDNRERQIAIGQVYNAMAAEVKDVRLINHDVLIAESKKFIKSIEEVIGQTAPPFENRPVGTPRGTAAVGDPCKVCGSPLKASKKDGGQPWCFDCWVAKKKN